jgi:trigger factor
MNPECKREVSIEIPAAEVKKATDAVAKRFQKLAKIPGFRAGKVPESIVRSRFAEDIRSEVVEQLLPKYYQQAIEDGKFQPVSQPYVTDLKFEEGKPVRASRSPSRRSSRSCPRSRRRTTRPSPSSARTPA